MGPARLRRDFDEWTGATNPEPDLQSFTFCIIAIASLIRSLYSHSRDSSSPRIHGVNKVHFRLRCLAPSTSEPERHHAHRCEGGGNAPEGSPESCGRRRFSCVHHRYPQESVERCGSYGRAPQGMDLDYAHSTRAHAELLSFSGLR